MDRATKEPPPRRRWVLLLSVLSVSFLGVGCTHQYIPASLAGTPEAQLAKLYMLGGGSGGFLRIDGVSVDLDPAFIIIHVTPGEHEFKITTPRFLESYRTDALGSHVGYRDPRGTTAWGYRVYVDAYGGFTVEAGKRYNLPNIIRSKPPPSEGAASGFR